MNQPNQKNSIPIKKIVISILLSFVLFFLIQLIFAFSLSKLSHYELYFSVTPWISGVFVAIFNAILFRGSSNYSPFLAALSSGIFFLISIGIGFLMKPAFSFVFVLARAVICTVLSALFAFLFSRQKKSKRRNPNFRFLK
jgi:hypothetical protein